MLKNMALSSPLQFLQLGAAESPSLSLSEALSGISGSISLASWIVVLVPQLIENFKNGNADGVSSAFLVFWLIGDICNLIGAIWAGLLPTVIALAIYFCIADCVMMGQVLYYKHLANLIGRQQTPPGAAKEGDNPNQPLLEPISTTNRRRTKRRSSASGHSRNSQGHRDSLSAILEKEPPTGFTAIKNILAILGTCLAGTAGWLIAYRSGAWSPADGAPESVPQPYGAMVLGYSSAVLYLGARIPQILQNYRKRSCDGLSVLFFMLSLLGNLTYGTGILFHSTEPSYIWDNLPWLIGSLGTMAEDGIIFCQFRMYKKTPSSSEVAVV